MTIARLIEPCEEISNKGDNLIFLISQPRSGSTLSQKILGNHPSIFTTSEPWLMLSPIYARRNRGITATYNSSLYKVAVDGFVESLPNGEDVYNESIRKMYNHLYGSALKGSSKNFFLDKTPRYYSIIPELKSIFPKAKFLILLRNPLAILASILNSWIKNDWLDLKDYKNDLFEAPRYLIEGIDLLQNDCHVFRYEELLRSPSDEIYKICQFLDIDFDDSLLNYQSHAWELGDHKTVDQKNFPDSNHLNKWIEQLSDPQAWRVMNDYLEALGEESIDKLGYSFTDIQRKILENRPSKVRTTLTLPLMFFLKERDERKSIEYEYFFSKVLRSLYKRGTKGFVHNILSRN